jgi:hypothetical protein
VYGKQDGSGFGVYGQTAGGDGVVGESTSGRGVVGSSGSGYGVYGQSAKSYAGYFLGNVRVTGTLTAQTKNFQIDDPLDPAHKYLVHSSVESSSMKDFYDGVVTTDGHGFATLCLPAWFEALNIKFRYQLTVVGHSFARAIVWNEIAHNRFTIRSDQPNVKVSWQVTGIRHDRYATAHPLQVVEEKPASAQGRYLSPQLYGKPARLEIGRATAGPHGHALVATR